MKKSSTEIMWELAWRTLSEAVQEQICSVKCFVPLQIFGFITVMFSLAVLLP